MKKIIVIASLLSSLSSFAAELWGTSLCLSLFANSGSSAPYAANINVFDQFTVTTTSEVSALMAAQIVSFAYFDESIVGDVIDALKTFDDDEIIYTSIRDESSGTSYQHIRGTRSDSELSAVFVAGKQELIAFTGDGDCYQIIR